MAALALREDTLDRFDRRVKVPTYDRGALTPAVVHLGVGCFHRSHQAVYFDEIAARGISTDWGIVGVGMRSPESRDALVAQDTLWSVVERAALRDRVRVIGVMGRCLFAPEEREAVLGALTDPRTRVVTMTVTATAYRTDTEEFRQDLAAEEPNTVPGYLVEALDRRRRSGAGPFTVLSCDNLPGNGEVARRAVLTFAMERDDELADWIREHVSFPNSMVDRITPRTTDADCAALAREFGVEDRCPVVTEPFSQWIVEDAFCNGRPPLDAVGVQLVRDVRPYALMKTRMLNAAHVAVGHVGGLAGLRRMDEAMRDPVVAAFADGLMREVAPLLPPVPGVDLDQYRETLLTRFANPRVADQLCRLGRNGSGKVPAHVLSSVHRAVAEDRPCELLLHAVAAWMRLLRGADDAGRPLEVEDPMLATLQPLARAGGSDPRPLLSVGAVFGDLREDLGFVAALAWALESQDRLGVRAAVAEVLSAAAGVAA
jgi:fructuronate reductase/mannitol 2-dehydrogenase